MAPKGNPFILSGQNRCIEVWKNQKGSQQPQAALNEKKADR
jgi:hypothetical protein